MFAGQETRGYSSVGCSERELFMNENDVSVGKLSNHAGRLH